MERKTYVYFQALKDRVSIADVLARLNVRLRAAGKSQLRGACPLPSHSSKDSRDSFFVNPAKRVWCCHSDSCKKASGLTGGTVIDLVAVLESVTAHEAALRLGEWFPSGTGGKPPVPFEPVAPRRDPDGGAPPPNRPLGFRLKDVNPEHPMIQAKGISVATATDYGIGFFPGKGSMAGRVVFELWENSQLIGYAGRATLPDQEPKWLMPKGLVKSFVYGLERCDPAKPLVLGESFWLPAFMSERGMYAAALMGGEMTTEQEAQLAPFEVIWLAFDNDDAGRKKAAPIADRLRKDHKVRITYVRE